MAFGGNHYLLTFHGKLPGGEDWSIGLRVGEHTIFSASQAADLAQPAAERFAAMRNTLAVGSAAVGNVPWSQGVTFDGVTARWIDPAGTTQGQAEVKPVLAMPASGVADYLPNQNTVCVTLGTGLPGRTRQGRVYLPTLGMIIGNDGRHTAQVKIKDAFTGFLSSTVGDWQLDATTAPQRWIIASRTNGNMSAITEVKVGNIVDTQRRRRSSLPETYVTGGVTVGA